ncbi:uncharacterized protein LOC100889620 [Strongylocentrotus purpuratus]|uniref:BTB domain-containing protein n=1 Tax=Strongylocentrotus purpuratus TaxID=7668 RepID=A0A7M7HNM2_STRPU|nr:uncharacterized protein LOC100889620 [Strongylocentrotus purpuratus]XP_011681089.2 uncharacterized protein LOC100889620 [Strongylocentrotus purpuratus]
MASRRDQGMSGRDTKTRPPSARVVSRRSRSASASGRTRQCQNRRGVSCERDTSLDRDDRVNGYCGIRLDLNCIPMLKFSPPRASTPKGEGQSPVSPPGKMAGLLNSQLSMSSASSTVSSSGSSTLIGAPRASDVMRILNDFRKDCLLSDLILQFSTGEIHCHRLVMAASSLYFRGMLFSESGRISRREIIQMQGVDMNIMQYLVDFAYTGSISGMSRDRVRKLKELASVFRFPEIGEACHVYLGRSLRENRNRSKTPTRAPGRQIFHPGSGRSSSGSGFSGSETSELFSPSPLLGASPLVESPQTAQVSPFQDHIVTSPKANGAKELLEGIASLNEALGRKHPDVGILYLPDHVTSVSRRISASSSESSNDAPSSASSELFSFEDRSFAIKMLREFYKIRKEGQLVDVVLRTATRDFPCHRVILQVHSPSLGAICQRELDGSKTMDVFIKRINPDTLQKVLNYFYTGKIAISQRDVKSVFKASKRFGLDAVREACTALDESIDRSSVQTDDSGISAPSSPNCTLDSPGI